MGTENQGAPAAAQVPERAATALLMANGKWAIGLATENQAGYAELTYGPYDTEPEALAVVDHINANLGVSKIRAQLIVISSMSALSGVAHAKRKSTWDKIERDVAGRQAAARP